MGPTGGTHRAECVKIEWSATPFTTNLTQNQCNSNNELLKTIRIELNDVFGLYCAYHIPQLPFNSQEDSQ